MNHKVKNGNILQRECIEKHEMLFGVLYARFQMITNPNKQWDKEVIIDVLMACVVPHNMILENKTSENLELAWEY
jgi:hypothetical protein